MVATRKWMHCLHLIFHLTILHTFPRMPGSFLSGISDHDFQFLVKNERCLELPDLARKLIRIFFGPSGVRVLPLAAGINVGGHYKCHFGPSGVRALPLAAGINVGGHYKCHFGPSRVRALPLGVAVKRSVHYICEYFFFFFSFSATHFSPGRGCPMVIQFCTEF